MLPDATARPRLASGAVTTHDLRARWAANEPAFAAWMLLESPPAVEALGAAGFDAIVVDLQHGAATLHDLPHLIRAIETTPAVPFVRTAWNDPAELMRVLDLGVRGVICPMIGSREEAEGFVRACRYPPAGARSYGPIRAQHGSGRDQTQRANADVLLFAMIETADGRANLDDIAMTPGLDGLFAGPTDLGLSLDLERPGDLTDHPLLEHLDAIRDAATAAGLIPAVHAPDPPRAADMAARGYRFISCAVDTDLLARGAVEAQRVARGPGSRLSPS
jgi:4-hydroxy-2-oxoheptanedioate aldolase